MKRTVLALSCLGLVIGACSKSGSGSGGGEPGGDLKPTGQEPAAAGVFTATGPAVKGPIKERLAYGCEKPGETSASLPGVDARLKLGDVITQRNYSNSKAYGLSSFKISETVKFIDANRVNAALTVLESSRPEVIAVGAELELECSTKTEVDEATKSTSTTSSCQVKPEVKTETPSEICYVNQSTSSTTTETPGTYRLESGQVVKAYLLEDVRTGEITCTNNKEGSEEKKRSVGNGREVYRRVVTNEALVSFWTRCGGADILSQTSLTLDNGELVSNYGQEYLSAPIVR